MVTINQLTEIVADIAGIAITKKHIPGPQVVRARNSDNTRLRQVLGWEPEISPEQGLPHTYRWIQDQVREQIHSSPARTAVYPFTSSGAH